MAQMQPSEPAKGLTGARVLGYTLAFLPPFICYKLAESIALGAGMGRWEAIGIGAIGALVGALIAGGLLYFVLVRKIRPRN